MPKTTPADLCYVFCAIDGVPPDLPHTGMPNGGPPRVVLLESGVALVVADVPAQTYAPEALEPKLSNLDWVSAAGAAHHAVIETLAEAGAVILPFRLFTLFSTDKMAVATMTERAVALASGFDRVRGKQEWVLRIGTPDPTRATAEPTPVLAPTSGTDFLQAKAEARRQAVARTARVHEDAIAAFDAIKQLADASKRRPVESGGTLIVDAAFLIDPSRVERLRAVLTERAKRLLNDGCAVSLTGPWPPYSFASVEQDSE